VRQLRRRVDAAVAPRRHRPLPMQRMRPLPQDEWHEPSAGEAAAAQRKSVALVLCALLYTSIKTAAGSVPRGRRFPTLCPPAILMILLYAWLQLRANTAPFLATPPILGSHLRELPRGRQTLRLLPGGW
jgi:hypothetical protein